MGFPIPPKLEGRSSVDSQSKAGNLSEGKLFLVGVQLLINPSKINFISFLGGKRDNSRPTDEPILVGQVIIRKSASRFREILDKTFYDETDKEQPYWTIFNNLVFKSWDTSDLVDHVVDHLMTLTDHGREVLTTDN